MKLDDLPQCETPRQAKNGTRVWRHRRGFYSVTASLARCRRLHLRREPVFYARFTELPPGGFINHAYVLTDGRRSRSHRSYEGAVRACEKHLVKHGNDPLPRRHVFISSWQPQRLRPIPDTPRMFSPEQAMTLRHCANPDVVLASLDEGVVTPPKPLADAWFLVTWLAMNVLYDGGDQYIEVFEGKDTMGYTDVRSELKLTEGDREVLKKLVTNFVVQWEENSVLPR